MHGGSGQKVTLGLLPIHSSNPFFETLAPPELVHDMRNAGFADGRPLWSGQRESSHLTFTFPFIAFFGGMVQKSQYHLTWRITPPPDQIPFPIPAPLRQAGEKGGGESCGLKLLVSFCTVFMRGFW